MLNWGIIGLGKIAHKFVKDMSLLEGHQLVSVASRSQQKAEAFAKAYGAANYYGSYKEIYADKEVDIIYIATPHDSHAALSLQAMHAGKHVLCEKPMGVNGTQVRKMINASENNQVFLMEAFWTRFNPSIKRIISLIKEGHIGEVSYINADFCFFGEGSEESRLFNMDLAGGALLDIGVYPIFLAYILWGIPSQIIGSARFHLTGADIQTAVILKFSQGMANLMCGFNAHSKMEAKIAGTAGEIIIDPRWHETEGFRVVKEDTTQYYSFPKLGKGYTYEIEECKNCIDQNLIQSQNWSHQNSLDLVAITDEIRNQIGLSYPFE